MSPLPWWLSFLNAASFQFLSYLHALIEQHAVVFRMFDVIAQLRGLPRRMFWETKKVRRAPMFVHEFENPLFEFEAAGPQIEPLFALPPTYRRRLSLGP